MQKRTKADLLRDASPDARAALVEALDELSRPLTRREIERALAPVMTRRERLQIVPALMALELIAIMPKRDSLAA